MLTESATFTIISLLFFPMIHVGLSLAAFAYNNVTQQKEIAESGGVRYFCFEPFMASQDEFYRCNAAFMVSS